MNPPLLDGTTAANLFPKLEPPPSFLSMPANTSPLLNSRNPAQLNRIPSPLYYLMDDVQRRPHAIRIPSRHIHGGQTRLHRGEPSPAVATDQTGTCFAAATAATQRTGTTSAAIAATETVIFVEAGRHRPTPVNPTSGQQRNVRTTAPTRD